MAIPQPLGSEIVIAALQKLPHFSAIKSYPDATF